MGVGALRLDPLYFRSPHKSFMRSYTFHCISRFHLRVKGARAAGLGYDDHGELEWGVGWSGASA